MTRDELDALAALVVAATPGPRWVGRFDDEHFMSAISVEAHVPQGSGSSTSEVIAATLIQQPAYVVPSDDRSVENAELIARMRNALPELLHLAAIGLAAEQNK